MVLTRRGACATLLSLASIGGLATMAYLSMVDDGVLGGINFHAGVRPRNLIDDPRLDARIDDGHTLFTRADGLPIWWPDVSGFLATVL